MVPDKLNISIWIPSIYVNPPKDLLLKTLILATVLLSTTLYSKGSTSIQLFIQTLILTDAAIARECSRHLVSRPLWPNVSSKLLEKDSEQQQLCLGSSNAKQLGQISETRQKLDWKIREIDGSYLCLQQFDMFLNMKGKIWPETEAVWICWNFHGRIRETTLGKLIFGGFLLIEITVQR